ncbi:MAG: hypothetical protein MJB14_12875, partial [Spirochaetes bacterium]|nr:hypothetical protein [Spirochaetota bacterium]
MKQKAVFLFVFFFLLTACKLTSNNGQGDHNMASSGNTSNSTNAKGWSKIAQLEDKGLTRQILDELDSMYDQAVSEKNHAELIKIIIYQVKHQFNITENAHIETLKKINKDIKELADPEKSIL